MQVPVGVFTIASLVASVGATQTLVKLTDAQSSDKGAVCLDGSNPAFYFGAANSTADSTKWVIYIKGGGWCYDEASCESRAHSPLGTTTHLTPTFSFGGVASDDPAQNPLMASWNHVVLWYCGEFLRD